MVGPAVYFWFVLVWSNLVVAKPVSGSLVVKKIDHKLEHYTVTKDDNILGYSKNHIWAGWPNHQSYFNAKSDVVTLDVNKYFPTSAVAVCKDGSVYLSNDIGFRWKKVRSVSLSARSHLSQVKLHFSPTSANIFLLNAHFKEGGNDSDDKDKETRQKIYITRDGGKKFEPLSFNNNDEISGCKFARIHEKSSLGEPSMIFCLGTDRISKSRILYRISGYGETVKRETKIVSEPIETAKVLLDYIVVVTANNGSTSSPKSVWTSKNGEDFRRALFPTDLVGKVKVLDNVHIGPRVMIVHSKKKDHDDAKKTVFISDSRGVKFSTLSESSGVGVAGLPSIAASTRGILFKNDEDFLNGVGFSSNYGYDWINATIVDKDGADLTKRFKLNLSSISHSYTYSKTISDSAGLIFASASITEGDNGSKKDVTLLSRDAGFHWEVLFDFNRHIAFGNYGNVLVALDTEKAAITYSLDQAVSWETQELGTSGKLKHFKALPADNAGTAFIVSVDGDEGSEEYLVSFLKQHGGHICSAADFDESDLIPDQCVDGLPIRVRTRRPSASCFLGDSKSITLPSMKPCACKENDYECSIDFRLSPEGCIPDLKLIHASENCLSNHKLELAPRQLTEGNQCKGSLHFPPVTVPCADVQDVEKKIHTISHRFDSKIRTCQYFNASADDSLLLTTDSNEVWKSHDGGAEFEKLDFGSSITEIMFNPNFGRHAYLLSSDNHIYVTNNSGHHFSRFRLPDSKQLALPLSFHPKDPSTFIYYGGKNCENIFHPSCHTVAYITQDGGKTFDKLLEHALSCEFVGAIYEPPAEEKLIMCEVKDKLLSKKKLVTSNDLFQDNIKEFFDNIIGFYSTGQFTAVAVAHDKDEIRSYVTVDGETYAESKFPADFSVSKQQSYTVIGSHRGAIFLHMSVSIESGREYGYLFKSNSNGTSFVTLDKHVNRDRRGFVDFETVAGLEGIILINVALPSKEGKRLKSSISFNDGAHWSYINPPEKNLEGKPYDCVRKGLEKCSLNLHGYVDRKDIRDTYSSGSALGYMIGVGNVGPELLPYEKCSTFMTDNGGVTWREIAKTPHHWEYGDSGSIIVLVPAGEETNTIKYTVDAGKTWNEYQFSKEKVYPVDIITVPMDYSMKFLLITQETASKDSDTLTFSISFAHMFERKCKFNPDNRKSSDFEYVPVFHPDSGQCLFGHKAEYLKKVKHDCFIGNEPLPNAYKIIENCACTRNDFECDYNFYMETDGTCKLVEGLDPRDAASVCKKNKDLVEYYEPTGYRKIPLSTCEGGLRLEKAGLPHPCPGKEKEFKKLHEISGFTLLYSWIFTSGIVAAILLFIYNRGIKRNGGFARFGEIRLGDDDLIEENQMDRVVNHTVRAGVLVYSWAKMASLNFKKACGGFYKSLKNRYFGRSGPSYSSLINDQYLDEADDLLNEGDNSDGNNLTTPPEGGFEISNGNSDTDT